MMRILLMIALLSACPAMASDWSSLWRNADQRGDLLLQQGNAAAAAKVYSNPRRKAYAEIQSGDYKSAAGQLAAVDEGDAHYNRGIALAHTGDLQGALHAFDTALKLDPKNKDARHNKALVAKALKQNLPKPQDKKSSSDTKKNKNKNKKDKQDKQKNKDNKDKRGNTSNNANKKQDATPSKPEKKSDQGQSGKSSDPSKAKPAANSSDASKAAKEAAQAKLDAQSSLEKPGKIDHHLAAKPPSEKQLAQAQWLRNIPDDPSGLLRRKFLIEYMMRKQQVQP